MSRYHQSYKAPTQNHKRNASQYYDDRKQTQTHLSSRELRMLKSSFEVFDLDNSGKISREEFKSTLRCLGYTASDEEIDSMMVSYDSNGDGLMDFDEFLSLVKGLKSKGYSYGKEAFEKELKNAFRVLDVDGDGFLTPGTLRHVLCNTGDRLRRAEIDDFLKKCDKDHDGRISYQELINIMCSSLEDHIKQLLP